MTSALTPPYIAAALVMLIAGLAKLRAPLAAADAAAMLGVLRLGRSGRERAVRAIAAGEIVLAGLALGGVAPAPYLLAVAYLAFAGVAIALLRVHGQCGCFGDSDAPVSAVHVTLNLVSAAVCLAAGAASSGGLPAVLRLPGWEVAPALAGMLAAGTAAVLVYTELPRAWQAWAGGAR